MNWKAVKEKVYYRDGSLRDIYILQTNLEDNRKWTDFVNSKYQIFWFNGLTREDENKVNFEVIKEYWEGSHDLCSTAKIFLNKIQINNHFFTETEIENDIDPREINSIEDHQKIVSYLTELSVLLDKPVLLTAENDKEKVLMRVLKDEIEYTDFSTRR